MGRISSRCRTLRLRAVASGLLIVLSGGVGPLARTRGGEVPRAEVKPAAADSPTWVEVVRKTQSGGIPAVLVVTSTSVPSSKSYARSVCQHPTTARLRSQCGVAELTIEDEPEQARQLGVSTYPTLVAYRRGQGGRLELAGVYRGGLSGEAISGWLLGLGLLQGTSPAPADASVATASTAPGPAPVTSVDAQIQRSQYPNPQMPEPSSQQPLNYPPPPPKVAPPVYAAPPPSPRVVYKKVAPPKRVVTRRVLVEPREVEVVEVPRRRVVREVEEAPRSLLTQPRDVEEVEVREIESPREREVEEVEVREIESPRNREVVEVREIESPREVVRVREVEAPVVRAVEPPAEVELIQPNVFDRFIGRIGRGLATRSNPRVAVESRREVVTLGAAPRGVVIAAPKEVAPCKHGRHCNGRCLAQPSFPPPAYSYPLPADTAPPYAPSPQAPR